MDFLRGAEFLKYDWSFDYFWDDLCGFEMFLRKIWDVNDSFSFKCEFVTKFFISIWSNEIKSNEKHWNKKSVQHMTENPTCSVTNLWWVRVM